MRNLLLVMGVIETIVGVGLLSAPSLLASILLSSPLEGAVGVLVARVGGAALLSLGVACLLALEDAGTRRATGIITAMLVYNVAVTVLLTYAGVGLGMTSMFLWLVIVVHVALAVWCVVCLRGMRTPGTA
jgi:hypothetical protein